MTIYEKLAEARTRLNVKKGDMKFWYKGICGVKKGEFWCFAVGLVRHEVRYLARCWEIIDEEVKE